jgi:hypothetical protein
MTGTSTGTAMLQNSADGALDRKPISSMMPLKYEKVNHEQRKYTSVSTT